MASASKSIPFAFSAQPVIAIPASPIGQAELALLLSLKDRVKQIEQQIAAAEESIEARLECGAAVETGLLKAFLKTTERRNVAWKSVVERELGEDYAKRVLAATKPDKYTNLIVTA